MITIKLTGSPNVFVSMPIEAFVEAGIAPSDPFEIYVEDDKIIIRKAQPDGDFVCDGDCATCPFGEVECADTKR